jgi:hypothetical protein
MTQLATRKGMLFPLAPQNGSTSDLLVSEESHRIREWLLAILRFAVTLEQCDRSVDGLGGGDGPSRSWYNSIGIYLFHSDQHEAVRLHCCKAGFRQFG